MSYYQSLSPKTEWHFYNALYIRELLQLVITDEILALKKEPRAVHYIFTCIHEFLKTEGIESYLKNVTDSNGNIVTTILDCSGRFWSFNSSLGLKSVIQEYGMDTFLLFQTKPHEPKKINFMNNIDIKSKLKNIPLGRKKLNLQGIRIISFSMISNNEKNVIENFLTIFPEKFKHAKWFEKTGIIPESCCYSNFSEQNIEETHIFMRRISDIKDIELAEYKSKIKDKSYETLERSLTYKETENQKSNHSFLITYSSIFNTFKFNQQNDKYTGKSNSLYYLLNICLNNEKEEKEWLTLFSEEQNKHIFTLIPLKSELIMEAAIPCLDNFIEKVEERKNIANTPVNNFSTSTLKNINRQYELYDKLSIVATNSKNKNRF